MLIYKGFIKVSKDGTFYPISRIRCLTPNFGNPQKTQIIFDDNNFIIYEHSMLKTIDIINGIKEQK